MPPLLDPELLPLELALPLDDPLLLLLEASSLWPESSPPPPPLPPLLPPPQAPAASAALRVSSEANAHPRTPAVLPSIRCTLAGQAYAGSLVCY